MATLRPSEQTPYFDVSESRVALGAAPTQVVKADAERVVLIIGIEVAASSATLSTRAGAASGQGLLVSQNERLELTQGLHGPLVTQAWFASSGAAVNITVLEMFLRRFPSTNLEGLTP